MSMITIGQQRTAFASLFGTLAALKSVHKYMPGALQDEECPALIMIPGDADYSQEVNGAHELAVVRQWTFRIAGQQGGIGDDTDAEATLDSLIDSVIQLLASYQRVAITETPDIGRTFDLTLNGGGDAGLATVTIADVDYAGTDITAFTQIEEQITPAWR